MDYVKKEDLGERGQELWDRRIYPHNMDPSTIGFGSDYRHHQAERSVDRDKLVSGMANIRIYGGSSRGSVYAILPMGINLEKITEKQEREIKVAMDSFAANRL